MTPNTRTRLFRQMKNLSAEKGTFRAKGAGRKFDEWWTQLEPHLLKKFEEHRAAGAVVLRSHLFVWAIGICRDLEIDLNKLKLEREWKDFRANLRKRIIAFCKRNKIKMKRASRQVYKDPKVIIVTASCMLN